MGDYNLICPGENVHVTLILNAGDISSSGSIFSTALFDANWNPRILQPYERLILDDAEVNIVSSGIGNQNTRLWLISSSTSPSFDSQLNQVLIRCFGSSGGLLSSFKEGISLPIGTLPYAVIVGNAPVVVSATVRLAGNGRITEGSTQNSFPNWQAER